ncbi:metal ABC transporter substrate-binding protein [Ilumatobacter coccineus]|uniref:Putative metal ABC transporter metal-binding protein n=1 Tax=Ilumatobacter coccineus (strain NBRC 103263 / KCTC 29153 / YM16-304) TaxID=1313172 RepID=A0A6C7EEK3_ILUCY|nr:metal ABC transporter substrate-binding protein [Ilumatobacter coccineus]BAN02406.1 putative metal ABC transporter metal-binding protein [Ilumatobacter coccineus YM16-304]
MFASNLTSRVRIVAILSSVTLLMAACGSSESASDADESDRLTVVTTVAPITSIAANIIGDRADIVGLVPEGTNSHTFEPSPSAAEVLSEGDAIFINGLQLEEPTKRLALAARGDDVPLVELGDLTIEPDEYRYDFSFPESEGKPNPHLWTDPTLVKVYADIIRDTMTDVDPSGSDHYDENYEAFAALVDEFDEAVTAALDTVPVGNRKLVTYHDAYAYFADTYGWTVVGAIQPSDFGEPTPSEVVALIEQIEAESVPAIFGSEVFPSAVLEQVANETGASYIDDLRDDDLPGAPGEVDHSWLGLMKFNFVTMTEALGGDATDLATFEVRDVAPDEATYPQ